MSSTTSELPAGAGPLTGPHRSDGPNRRAPRPQNPFDSLAAAGCLRTARARASFRPRLCTPDGTCIRDYIHIVDLCAAHSLALADLVRGGDSAAYNLDNGNGFSVRQVIDAVQEVTGRPIPTVDAPRRPGEPARLVADSTLARTRLGWSPRYADLHEIVFHAWNWDKIAGL